MGSGVPLSTRTHRSAAIEVGAHPVRQREGCVDVCCWMGVGRTVLANVSCGAFVQGDVGSSVAPAPAPVSPLMDLLCSCLASVHSLVCSTCGPDPASLAAAARLCVHPGVDAVLQGRHGQQGSGWVWFLSTAHHGHLHAHAATPGATALTPTGRRGLLSSRFRSARDIVTPLPTSGASGGES
jgi:hypothetical protein